MTASLLMKELRGYFPNANISVTNYCVGVTMLVDGQKIWYGKLIKMPKKEERQPFISDTVKWFKERFG